MATLEQLTAQLAQLQQERRRDRADMQRITRRARLSTACALCALALSLLANTPLPRALAQSPAATLDSLLARVQALEQKTAALTQTGKPGQTDATLTVTGVNVQIVNGLGRTETQNGLGNLVVGYDERRGGGTDTRTGSHNIVTGNYNNYTSSGGIIGGIFNSLGGVEEFCVGYGNTVLGPYSTITGGDDNTASGRSSSVSGGDNNTASGEATAVSGGQRNTASSWYSAVSGGGGNTASGSDSVVSGGEHNTAGGYMSAISGGSNRTQSRRAGWTGGAYHTPRLASSPPPRRPRAVGVGRAGLHRPRHRRSAAARP